MTRVENRAELSEAMLGGEERVTFPANTNLLLNDGAFLPEQIDELEQIAQMCGRSVHRC
jgi:hypothetical protein